MRIVAYEHHETNHDIYFAANVTHQAAMTLSDAIRRAHECREFAGMARDAEMRQRWLEMADEWMRLAGKEAETPAARFCVGD